MTKLRSFFTATALAASFGALSLPAQAEGVIDVAIIGEPDTLDPMMSTKDVVSTVTQHFYETLFTFNGNWEVVPLLADAMPAIAEEGKLYTIPIRQGVTFHDGSAMDANDVVDSLKRWTEVATRGKGVADKIASIEATDDYTVEIRMNEAYSPLLSLLAFSNSAAAIYPQENISETIGEVIGTGPYKLVEHRPDQFIQVERFEDYASRDEPSDAAAGARKQVLDEIRFVPVPDPNTRLEGLMSGQYHFAEGLETEAFSRLEGSETAEPVLLRPFGWPVFAFNHHAGLMTDLNVRRAVQAALSPDDMLYAAFGDENFFVVDGPLYPEGYVWRNKAGIENYAQADAERAAEYLEKAGYDGTPLRILTSHQYEFHFKMAEVAKVNLEAAGFTVDMQVVDWATLGERRNVPDLWDIYITHSPFLPEPALTSLYNATANTGWADEEKEKVLNAFTSETDPEKRAELFTELQRLVYEQAAFYKVGGFNALMGKSRKLEGMDETPWPFFWNASLAE
ncbi:ABC transporter substrate-binding protein [Chelativorans alearense]|uniref:ABC transporter substrate-binding protein n=1 Tax=Chelativorans alearense TaxID=2681495 RepID=UPI0013D65D52|nr:ABC transporter substrate-binding protein [Chelativorans alearense]